MESGPCTHVLAAACGRFHAVFICLGPVGTDVAVLLNKDTFEPDAAVFTVSEASSSKDTWEMTALVVRGLLRRPSRSGSPTVTFCSVHVHNIVAKKRDASTPLLRRLRAHMLQHNVDFMG